MSFSRYGGRSEAYGPAAVEMISGDGSFSRGQHARTSTRYPRSQPALSTRPSSSTPPKPPSSPTTPSHLHNSGPTHQPASSSTGLTPHPPPPQHPSAPPAQHTSQNPPPQRTSALLTLCPYNIGKVVRSRYGSGRVYRQSAAI